MKLFYSYMGRSLAYYVQISKIIHHRILLPANNEHRLVMFGRHFLILCFVLFSIGVARSQSRTEFGAVNKQSITPLNIGDPIPNELWGIPLQVVNHPEGKENTTLSEYKGQLIILDFWATWCTVCVRNFPKLHDLQNEFGDKMKVLAVTNQDTDVISKFFATGVGKEHTYVHSVINDKVLTTYFPHFGVPHVVWISPDGIVLNTTQADQVNQVNIQAILNDQTPNMVTKTSVDRNKPLFLSEKFGDNIQLKAYSIFAKGYYPGLPQGNKIRKTKEGNIYGRQINNANMMTIYRAILYPLFEKNGEKFNSKKVVLEVKEPALLISKKGGNGNDHLYNYELIVPHDKIDSLFDYMLADLNRYSGYIGTIENRMVDCLVLVKISSLDEIKTEGDKPKISYTSSSSGVTLVNQPMSYFINILNDETSIKLPVIDETGYTENVDLTISDFTDLGNLKNELNRYGLDLIPSKRNLNMFVIKDK